MNKIPSFNLKLCRKKKKYLGGGGGGKKQELTQAISDQFHGYNGEIVKTSVLPLSGIRPDID